MTNIAKDVASKALVAFVAVAMLFTMFATPAQAQTAEELQQMINDLMAQIATLQSQVGQGGTETASGVCPFTWTRDLTMGSQGADVMKLQQFLNADPDTRVAASGVGSVGMETEYFGALTAAAVSKMQVKYRAEVLTPSGLINPTGYFGPSSRAKANAVCATPAVVVPPVDEDDDATEDEDEDEDDSTSGPLMGGEGFIEVDEIQSSISTTTIDLGDSETVIEVEVTAEDSDVEVNRVDFLFTDRPWLYFEEVNLTVNGEVVATLDRSSDFSEVGSNYRARFSGLDLVIREDDSVDVGLELVVLESMSGTRDQGSISVWHPRDGIRYVDAAGISETAPSVGFPNDGGSPANDVPGIVAFDDTFGNGDVVVVVGDNSPENATIVLNETTRTDDVAVLEFDVEADESDIEVTEVSVEFDATGGLVANTVYRAYLYVGNTLLGSETVNSSTTVFEDVDYVVEEDDIVTFRVEVDFNEGEDVTATDFTVVEVVVDGEDDDFTPVSDSVTVDETHTIITSGLVAEIDSIPSPVGSNDDKNFKFTFVMDVTAYEDTFYFSDAGTTSISASIDGSAGTSTITGIAITSDASLTGDDTYRISRGQTRSVTVEVFVEAGVSGTVRVTLDGLNYNTASDLSGTADTAPLGSPDFRSATVNIIGS